MSIFTAIGGLVGGALDRRHDTKQTEQNREWYLDDRGHTEQRADSNLQRLVKDAQGAGLSPLAALGSSAAGQVGSPVMGQSKSGSNYGSALAAAGSALDKRKVNALQTEGMQLQNDLVRAQISNMNAETAIATSRSHTAGEASAAQALALGTGLTKETRIHRGSGPVHVAPGLSDAEDWEARYGELGGLVGGVVNALSDFGANVKRDYNEQKKYPTINEVVKKRRRKYPSVNESTPVPLRQ